MKKQEIYSLVSILYIGFFKPILLLMIFLSFDCMNLSSRGVDEHDREVFNHLSNNATVIPISFELEESEDYQMEVNGTPVPCYTSLRNDSRNPTTLYHGTPVSPLAFAKFDFEGEVRVKIIPRDGLINDIDKLVIRPLSLNIKKKWDGHVLLLSLKNPGNITIDAQGDGMYPLHIFSNLPEKNIPDPEDPNVVYFGPGIHDIEQIVLTQNQTLYLEAGAVLRPNPPKTGETVIVRNEVFDRGEPMIKINRADNVTIRGRGIISGGRATENMTKSPMITATYTNNFKVQDILLIDGSSWSVHIFDSEHAEVNNLKVIGYYINVDGVCFNGSRHCVVRNCFVHTNDDCYEIKAMNEGKVSADILFENCVVWNDFATSMGVTHEVVGTIAGITWKNMTIIRFNPLTHENWLLFRAAIFVHAQGGGSVSDLTFEDITIEMTDTNQPLILVDNFKYMIANNNSYPDKPYNPIENISFRRITATNISNPDIVIYDESANGIIKDITFEDVIINNQKVVPGDPRLKITNAKNINIIQ